MNASRRNCRYVAVAVALAASAAVPATAAETCITGAVGHTASIERRTELSRAHRRQAQEIAALKTRMRAMNCSLGSVVVIDGPQRTDCPRLNDILNQMQRNLDAIAAQRDAVSLRAHDGSQPSPCAPGQPAIRGVSQYDDPDNANILNLAPHAGGKPEQWRFDKGGAGGAGTTFSEPPPTQTHAAADPASSIVTVGNARSSVPGNLASGAPGVARPMTEKQRNVRVVGPQFLPDPSTSIDFDKH